LDMESDVKVYGLVHAIDTVGKTTIF